MKIAYAALIALGLFSYFYMGAYKGGSNFEMWKWEFTNWMDVSIDFIGLADKLSNWLVSIKNSTQYITKPFFASLCLMPVIITTYFIYVVFNWIGNLRGVIPSWQVLALVLLFFTVMAPVFYFLINFTRFGLTGLLILIFSLLFFAAELFLKLLRGLAWRIAEHIKGAFAAIVLIITVALGVTEVYLKTKNPANPPAPPTQTSQQPPQSSSP